MLISVLSSSRQIQPCLGRFQSSCIGSDSLLLINLTNVFTVFRSAPGSTGALGLAVAVPGGPAPGDTHAGQASKVRLTLTRDLATRSSPSEFREAEKGVSKCLVLDRSVHRMVRRRRQS